MRIVLDVPDEHDARLLAAFERRFTDEDGVKPTVSANFIRKHLAAYLVEFVRNQEQAVENEAVRRVERITI